MWVQMEWSCPQTTPRTTPVDRPACILSPCLRTMVGFPQLAFLFSDSSPVSSKLASPLGNTVSWDTPGGGFLARGERGTFPGVGRGVGMNWRWLTKARFPKSPQHSRLAGRERLQMQPAGRRGTAVSGPGAGGKGGGAGWRPHHSNRPSKETPAMVRSRKEPVKPEPVLRVRETSRSRDTQAEGIRIIILAI